MEEKASSVECHSVGDSSCWRFTWTIVNFSKLKVRNLYSDDFYAGGYKWRILIYPEGNNVDYLSMYLDVADAENLPSGWSKYAQFILSVINQTCGLNSVKNEAQHVFNAEERDWGFTSFISLTELHSSAGGFILQDKCIVEAEVTLKGVDKQELKRREEAEECPDTVTKSVEAEQEQSKPPNSEAGIPGAHETELPPTSVNVPPEQVIPLAEIEEHSEQAPVLEETKVLTEAEHDSSSNSLHSDENLVTRSTALENEDVETLKMEDTQEETITEPTSDEAGKNSSSFAEFDKLFTDVQNLVEGKTSKAENLSSFCTSPSSAEEIADAKKIFKQCINMDLSSIIRLRKASELKNSLGIMLTSNAFADNMVDATAKFLAEFDQSCERYESAKQELSEAQEDEKEVDELKTTLKQRFAEFIPLRNQAEAVDREIARLEKQVVERKAKKERLSKRLEDLAGQATTSKEALVSAEQRMKPSAIKKEQAEKAVDDIKKSWESLKFSCSVLR